MAMQESLGCVVVWYHIEWQEPAYQVYSGLLFSLPLAVTSFNRFSRLVEALSRRLCRVLVSLYFDDATITDLRSYKGSGQLAVNQLCAVIGSPFAEDKKQPMQPSGTFLGHDLASVNSNGYVKFWARSRLHDKVKDILATARASIQALWHCQFLGTGHLRTCGLWGSWLSRPGKTRPLPP